jgi:hypothetical protein
MSKYRFRIVSFFTYFVVERSDPDLSCMPYGIVRAIPHKWVELDAYGCSRRDTNIGFNHAHRYDSFDSAMQAIESFRLPSKGIVVYEDGVHDQDKLSSP